MSFEGLLVTEIFHSIQGESSLSGKRFAFIRLTGCNLRCSYCDSTYSFKGGSRKSIQEILDWIEPYSVDHVLLTGGEPLLQRNTAALLEALNTKGYRVSIETHGEVSISNVVGKAKIIMDAKTPSSGMNRMGFLSNLPFLRETDEVKFVIASADDYYWAKRILENHPIPTAEILFSAANPLRNTPGSFPGVSIEWLAQRILEDKLRVRLQTQLHKIIWGAEKTGV